MKPGLICLGFFTKREYLFEIMYLYLIKFISNEKNYSLLYLLLVVLMEMLKQLQKTIQLLIQQIQFLALLLNIIKMKNLMKQ